MDVQNVRITIIYVTDEAVQKNYNSLNEEVLLRSINISINRWKF